MQLLIVDANPESAERLASRLRPLGFVPQCVSMPPGTANREALAGIAAVILDCDSLPWEPEPIVRRFRAAGVNLPLALLSSAAGWRERTCAFDAGADDFINKPIRSEELAARIRALVRRSAGSSTDEVISGDVRLDLRARCAWRGTRCLDLTRSEFRLLRILMLQPEHTIDHETIWQSVHSGKPDFSQNAVEVLVARLRRKVGHDRIRTVRGVGYRIVQTDISEHPPGADCLDECERKAERPSVEVDTFFHI